MKRFEINKTYQMTFIGDSELIVPISIIKRTAKMITFRIRNAEQKKAKIFIHNNAEYFFPEGKYSMAPTCYAKKNLMLIKIIKS